jgi:truncated hemoglobin YjbI
MTMKRSILVASIVFAVSGFVACGGDDKAPANDPSKVDTAASASASTSASAMTSAMPSASTATVASAAPSASTPPPAPKPLYERLGGKAAIETVVDKALAAWTTDKRIAKYFAKTVKDKKKVAALRQNIIDQITQATGGGDGVYKGKDMKSAHAGMKIDDAAFGAFVEDLVKVLTDAGVSKDLQDELLKPLGDMKADIVAPADAKKGK